MDRRWDKSKPPRGPFTLNRDCPQAQGLVAWYPMGMAGGNYAADAAGSSHLAIAGAPSMTLSTDGAPAISLNGSTQYLEKTTAIVSAAPLTLAAWFKKSALGVNSDLIGLSRSNGGAAWNNDRFQLFYRGSDNKLLAVTCGSSENQGVAVTSTAHASASAWAHACAVFTSSASRAVYLDGGSKGTDTTSITPASLDRSTIGCVWYNSARTNYHTGSIGESGYWNVALDDRLVWRLYNPGTRFELWYPPRSRKWFTQGAGGSADLTIADASHAQAADNLALTTASSLTVADATHAHAADNLALTTASSLTVADATHAHVADNLALTTASSLTVADAAHAHAADNVALTTASSLTVADAAHAHAADNVELSLGGSETLTVADAAHAHAADALSLSAQLALAVQDALHAQTSDQVGIYLPSAGPLIRDPAALGLRAPARDRSLVLGRPRRRLGSILTP